MHRIKIIVLLIIGSLHVNQAACAEGGKYALIIGIGKYEPGNGWNLLHADNDAEVIKHTLIMSGFPENNLLLVTNEKATKTGIVDGLTKLLSLLNLDDIAVIHYSGHGQQLTDIDGDEPDGLDEALVPYDAPSESSGKNKNYNGSLHLTDDELSGWFDKIRNKVGSKGQLIVFLDACHSGTASRGNLVVRGGLSPIILQGKTKNQTNKGIEISGYNQENSSSGNRGKFVLIAATKSQDPDYEHPAENMGSLTYAVAEALQKNVRTSENTYRDLFEYIRNTMAVIVPSQTPQIEGDMDITIFNGSFVVQQPYYKILNEEKNGLQAIAAGKILAVKKGVKIGFYPIGTRASKDKLPVVSGAVEIVENMKSYVRTDRMISRDSLLLLQAFILSDVYEKNQVRVFIQDGLPESIKSEISPAFTRSKMQLVGSRIEADIVIEKKMGLIHLVKAADGNDLVIPFSADNEIPVQLCGGVESKAIKPVDYIVATVTGYSKSNILKKINFIDNNLRLDVKLIPEENPAGSMQQNHGPVFAESAKANLTIINTGTRAGYVYLIEFDPEGRICELIGFDTQIRLEPGRQDITTIEFIPPFGRYLIKAYMTEEPIGNELRWLINSQLIGEKGMSGTRGSTSELIQLLSSVMENPVATRSGPVKSGGVTITNFSYDLINNK